MICSSGKSHSHSGSKKAPPVSGGAFLLRRGLKEAPLP